MPPELARILDAGNQAPSGENCQPWHFIVRGLSIEVHLLPDRDQSAYSWGQRASYLADGTAIENMVIAASREGYRANVSLFPQPIVDKHVATITLSKDASLAPDPLAGAIEKRVTNRKPYENTPLTAEERAALCDAASLSGRFVLLEDHDQIKKLGRVGSTNEEVMLSNRGLHDFFFSHVNWTKQEDEHKKIGFYIQTLELPPPAQALFKLFKYWPVMNVLAHLSFTTLIASQNAAINASAAAIGAFMIKTTAPRDFVEIGRAVERLWLAATAHGLYLQPMTGVLFFRLKIANGEGETFSAREQQVILDAYERAADIVSLAPDEHMAFMCRIGHAEPPSAQAVRFPLSEVVEVVS